MKKFEIFLSTLILLFFAVGCEEEDKFIDITQSIVAPSNLAVLYNITQDNTGNVTITPSAEAAHAFDIDFGDGSDPEAEVAPGDGATHQYAEGSYQVGLTAKGLNDLTTTESFPLDVSFRAPENLMVTTAINQANPFEVSVEASADYETYFHVYFGEDPDADPIQINEGAMATHEYAAVGTYTIRVVALSGGAATTEHTEEVVISAPTALPIDFEVFDTTVFFDFGGTSHEIVTNPDQSGENTSETVAKIVKGAGEVWAGNVIITTDPIDFSSKTTMKMKVWSPRAGVNVLMKLENLDDANINGELSQATTTANAWEELSFDFSALDTSNTYQKIVLFFDIGTVGDGSADWTFYIDDISQMVPNLAANPLVGSWKLAPEAGALAVGPNPNDFSWWSNNAADVTTRACLFDDEYVFNADGSFQNILGAETWVEGWQPGQTGESCGVPIAPHDGTNAATWSSTDNTITISGDGAFLGLAKVHNAGEDGDPANDTITYNYTLTDNDNTLIVTIQGFNAGVPDATWKFTFTKDQAPANPLVGSWKLAPEAETLAVGPNPNDFSWWSNNAADVTTRACLFDDEYVFNADGSFQNILGAETWVEGWQPGQTGESCGVPIAPHDGTNAATWSSTASTITISGDGAFLGLAKVHNAGEDGDPANDTITYNYSLSDNDTKLEITIQGFNAGVPDATWRFRFIKN